MSFQYLLRLNDVGYIKAKIVPQVRVQFIGNVKHSLSNLIGVNVKSGIFRIKREANEIEATRTEIELIPNSVEGSAQSVAIRQLHFQFESARNERQVRSRRQVQQRRSGAHHVGYGSNLIKSILIIDLNKFLQRTICKENSLITSTRVLMD